MAESRPSSLNAKIAEKAAQLQLELEQRYNEVDQISSVFETQISELQSRINKSKEKAYGDIADFEEELKRERLARTELDTTKYSRGNQAGASYRESLVNLEATISTKLGTEKTLTSEYHEKVKFEYQGFKGNHDQLRQQMPDSYIQGAKEYKEYLGQKSQEKTKYLTEIETYIQQQNETQAANRLALANVLEAQIQDKSRRIGSLRTDLKVWTDMKKTTIHQRLGAVAAKLGIKS